MRIEGSVILTAGGSYVDPLALRPEDVRIAEIAHALSNQCRFSGHVSRFYSVAEHPVRVAGMREAEGEDPVVCMWGLLHDASEAYLVDLPSPLKLTPTLGTAYLTIESSAQDAIADAFGLPLGIPEAVKRADLVLLATERRDLMPPAGEWAILDGVEPLPTSIVPASPEDARAAFMEAFEDLSEALFHFRGLAYGQDETLAVDPDLFARASREFHGDNPGGSRTRSTLIVDMKPTNPKDAVAVDKLPLHLWPASATALGCVGLLDGMLKYGRANWREAGVRASVYVDALGRHVSKWFEGEEVDGDSGVPHLAHALACLAIIVDAEANGKLVDDRNYNGAGYLSLVESLTPHVARLREKHAHRSPRHFNISSGTTV